MKTAVFIGHSDTYGLSEEKLRKSIIYYINCGVTQFFNGGQGGFDRLCAKTVFELKNYYPYIKNSLIIPYPNFKIFEKKYFDEIIFPDNLEKHYYKYAIPERNKYMVDKSEVAICFINHGWGNAVKTFEFALKKNLETVNLGNYTPPDNT